MAVALTASLHSCMPPLLIILLIFSFPSPSLCMRLSPHPHPQPLQPLIAPAPTSGGDLPQLPSERFRASSPSNRFTLDPLEPSNGPAPSDAPSSESDNGVPLIYSNPAVPLPSDVTDSASFLPLPSRGNDSQEVGKGALLQIRILIVVFSMICSFLAGA